MEKISHLYTDAEHKIGDIIESGNVKYRVKACTELDDDDAGKAFNRGGVGELRKNGSYCFHLILEELGG